MGQQPFSGIWQDEFQGWQEIVKIRRERRKAIKVRAIILGPGKQSKGYEKRLKIREHLKQVNPENDVAFLEELLEEDDPGNKNEIIRNQAYFVKEAQVIIAILIKDRNVTGVNAELVHYRNSMADFEDKTWLIVPRPGGKKASRGRGLLQTEIENFHESHKLAYNFNEFQDCTKIRSFAEKVIEDTRSKIFFRKYVGEMDRGT